MGNIEKDNYLAEEATLNKEKGREVIQLAVEHLLEADIREGNDWSADDIKMLEYIVATDFEINFKKTLVDNPFLKRARHLIRYAAEHLLEADLSGDNGWSMEDVEMLEYIHTEAFEVHFKN